MDGKGVAAETSGIWGRAGGPCRRLQHLGELSADAGRLQYRAAAAPEQAGTIAAGTGQGGVGGLGGRGVAGEGMRLAGWLASE